MTVAAKSPFELYDGDGVTTAFAVRWRYLDVAHLLAEKIDANETVTVLVNGTDYTATAAPTDAGGTLTLTTALAAGEKLRIRRKTPLAQPTQYPTSGSFPASSHELALDRLTLQGQEAAEQLARTPQVPVGETAPELNIAAIAPGQVLALVGDKIQGVDNNPASAADSAAQANLSRIAAQTAQGLTEDARDETQLKLAAAQLAQAGAESARDEALTFGAADIYATWVLLAAATGMVANDSAMVVSSDTGTHTDPVVGGTVNNAGVYQYSTSPAGWKRVADLQGQIAETQAGIAATQAGLAATNAARYDRIAAGQRNLFDRTRVTAGKTLNISTGAETTSAGNNISHAIPVIAGAWYTCSTTVGNTVWLTNDGTFISGFAGGTARPFQAPANAAFVRTVVSDANLATFQWERGKLSTPYQAYSEGYRQSKLFYRTVPNDALQALAAKKNLIDPARLLADWYIIHTTGAIGSNASYNVLLPVPCKGGTTYYSNKPHLWACYDADMGFLSGGNPGSAGTFTTHANAVYLASSVTDANLSGWQLEAGSSGTTFEAFQLVVDPALVGAVPASAITGGISGSQAAFMSTGKNLVDPAQLEPGKYIIKENGNVGANASFTATGFIPVVPGQVYSWFTSGGTGQDHAWYTASRTYLGTSGNVASAAAPDSAAFWRGSFRTVNIDQAQFEQGPVVSIREDYRFAIPERSRLIEQSAVLIPRKLYALRGGTEANREQFNVYFDQVFRGTEAGKLPDCNGSFGIHLEECWRLEAGNTSGTGSSATFYNVAAGATFNLDLMVTGSDQGSRASVRTAVQVVDKTAGTGTQIRHLGIGDSNTAWNTPTSGADRGVNYLQQIPFKLTNAVLQGTRQYASDNVNLRREGRSGWSLATYLTNFGLSNGLDSPFMFPDGISGANYRGNVTFWSNVVATDDSSQAFGGFQKLARGWADSGPFIYDGSGYPTSPTTGWIVFDPSFAVGSRFREWNGSAWVASASQPTTWAFDFGKYLARFPEAFPEGNPTHVSILSLANDFQVTTPNAVTLAAYKARLDTIITSIRAALPSAKIIICLAPVGADQDAWAYQFGSGQTGARYAANIKTANAYVLAQYDTAAQEAAGVFVCATHATVDPRDFIKNGAAEPISIYSSQTITRTLTGQWVHMSSVQHQQMGDALAALVQATRA